MAIAKIEITCSECGRTFWHEKKCCNRRDADNYEAWAADCITCCPECYAKQRADKKSAMLREALAKHNITLGKIKGKSDRQIAYAEDIRTRYLAKNIELIGDYAKVREDLANEETASALRKIYADRGLTYAEGLWHDMSCAMMTKIDAMMNETDAAKIIDEGRGGCEANKADFIARYSEQKGGGAT